MISFMNAYVLAFWDEIFFGLTQFGSNDDFSLAFRVLAEGNHTINLRNDRKVLGLSCFEKLCNPAADHR